MLKRHFVCTHPNDQKPIRDSFVLDVQTYRLQCLSEQGLCIRFQSRFYFLEELLVYLQLPFDDLKVPEQALAAHPSLAR